MYDILGNKLKKFIFWIKETDYINFLIKLKFYNIPAIEFFRWVISSFLKEDEDLMNCLYKLTKDKKSIIEKIYLTSYQSTAQKQLIEIEKMKERKIFEFLENKEKNKSLFDIKEEDVEEIE